MEPGPVGFIFRGVDTDAGLGSRRNGPGNIVKTRERQERQSSKVIFQKAKWQRRPFQRVSSTVCGKDDKKK